MHFNINPGDLLYRQKGIVDHVGVYLGGDQVAHHSPRNGVEIVSYKGFATGQEVNVVRGRSVDPDTLMRRFLSVRGRSYNLVIFNCEHFASYMLSGKRSSGQLRSGIIGAALTACIAHKNGKKYWWAYGAFGGLAGCIGTNLIRKFEKTHTIHAGGT